MRLSHWLSLTAVSCMMLVAAGCGTTREDVMSAREEARQERQDLQEMQTEDAADDDRTEYQKPVLDNDADDADRTFDGSGRTTESEEERIREQQQQVREAEAEARESEQELKGEQARDTFAIEARKHIDEANREIEKLRKMKDAADDQKDARLDDRINRITALRDELEGRIDDLEAADANKWETHKEPVEQAMKDLRSLMEKESPEVELGTEVEPEVDELQ